MRDNKMANIVKISVICSGTTSSTGEKSIEKLNAINSLYWRSRIDQVLPSKPDLIILPETCDSFSDLGNREYHDYIAAGGTIADMISNTAKDNNCYITYPGLRNHPTDSKFPFRNSNRIFDRKGILIGTYDKNHVMTDENDMGIGYGNKAEVIQTDFGKIACVICFDLNFDMLLRKYAPQKPDLVVFSSAYHGGLRQGQWAYGLRCHFAGAIRRNTGRILNPFATELASTTNHYDYVTQKVNLDCAVVHLDYNMAKIAEAKRKYKEELTIYDPGNVASVLLTCESTDKNIHDIIKEFDIELLDDYLDRALRHREKNINNI
jgi:hypothetical protein